jgi:O-6-methylguanine DNA methyltransferase
MQHETRRPFAQARALVRQLHDLGNVCAPATVLPSVLEDVGQRDAYTLCTSPLGPLYVAYNGLGISAVMTAASAAEFEQAFRARFKRSLRQVETLPATLARMWEQQWSGTRRPVPRVDLRGLSEFERAVLHKAGEVPRGEMRPYAWVAREIGHPKAVRAVGTALRRNPVPLLIPCHRIGKSDGRIGNYAFGSAAKHAILTTEGVDVDTLEHLAQAGVRYHGSDTTRIYCFPTCRHARRISARHRVSFRSEAAAAAAGYRPCAVCRPALAA